MASESVTSQTNFNERLPKNFKVLFHRPLKCYCNEIENVNKPHIIDFKKILSERYEHNRSKIVCCFVMVAQAPERLTVENDLINTPSSAMINRRRRDFQLRIFTANFQTILYRWNRHHILRPDNSFYNEQTRYAVR
jgi:hypothetical protein